MSKRKKDKDLLERTISRMIKSDFKEGFICPICKKVRKPTIHHIKGKSLYPELISDRDNLKLMCRECHNKIHQEGK